MIKTRLIVLTIPKSKLANQTTKLFDLNSRILELAPETYKENNELTSITPGLGEIKSGYGNQIARKYAYFSCFNRNLVKLTVRDNFALPQSLCCIGYVCSNSTCMPTKSLFRCTKTHSITHILVCVLPRFANDGAAKVIQTVFE